MTTGETSSRPQGYADGGARPGGGPRRAGGGRPPRVFARRKVCAFCVGKATQIDYKDVGMLRRYISNQFKIESRRKTGVCSKHQRMLTRAIKRARHVALLPINRTHRLVGAR